jgi:aryl-alcohol dehydrogenase-like predicted oxidoreductase
MAQTYGVALIPWSPLAGGLLTGKYSRNAQPPEDSRFADVANNPRLQARMTNDIFDVVDGIQPLADAKGCTVAQLALAWCMNQPGVTSPIIGPRTMAQLEDNLGALDVTITAEDRAVIDGLVPSGRMVSPFYEADFGPEQYR